jgi:AbrB family looped-hinge helix DNA binding protein
MATQHLARVQEKGQITLPAEMRRRLGLKKGDVVAITETADGMLVAPQEVVAAQAMDRIGELLRAQGLTLEDLLEASRDERASLLQERYDIEPSRLDE